MTVTVPQTQEQDETVTPWQGFRSRALAERDQRSRLHPAELRAVRRRRIVPAPATPRTQAIWDSSRSCSSRSGARACSTSRRSPAPSRRTRPATSIASNELIVGLQTDAPLKRAIMPNGGFRMVAVRAQGLRLRRRSAGRETFTKYRKTHNEGVFDAYTADVRRCRSSHILTGLPDAYGRGRIIGDYRRVALYGVNRLIERKEEEKRSLDSRDVDRRDHPRPRGAVRADPRAEGAAADGRELRLRHLASGGDGAGSGAVALLRLSRRREGTERRGDVARTDVDVPRHLLRARSRRWPPHRRAGPGDRRRLRHQAAHRPVPADAGVRRALRRRSHLGHRIDRRHGRRRPLAGDEDELPHAADALQPRSGAGAESHDLVLAAPARRLPALRRQGRHRHELAAVRERRDHAPRVGRRRRDRVLRVADARRQADAVLRRARQPRQVPALRHQRRARRDQRRADRAGAGAGDRRHARLRRRDRQVRADDGLARRRLRQRHEHHPLHARQVRLRAGGDGAARLRAAPHDGVRHGRHVGGGRQPVGDQAREGARRPRRHRADHRLSDRGRRSRSSATTTTASISSPSGWSARS